MNYDHASMTLAPNQRQTVVLSVFESLNGSSDLFRAFNRCMRRKTRKAEKGIQYLAIAGGAQYVPPKKAERPLDLSRTVAVGAGTHLSERT